MPTGRKKTGAHRRRERRDWAAPWESRFAARKPLFYAGFFLAALLVRVAYVFSIRDQPTFDEPLMDGAYHHRVAEFILERGLLGADEPFYRSPLYMYLLALVYKIFGVDFLSPRLVGAFFGAVNVALIVRVAERVFSPAPALLAGVIALFCWPMIFFDGELLATSMTIMMGLVLLLLFIRAVDAPTVVNMAALGLFFGLTAITRENYLPIIGLAFLFFAVYWRRALLPAVFLASALVGIAPVTFRNYVVLDDFVPITHYTPVNLYIGNNPWADGRTAIVPFTRASWWGGVEDVSRITEEAIGRPPKPSDISAYWAGKTLEYVRDDFGHFLFNVAKKFGFIFDLRERSNNKEMYFFRAQSPLLSSPLFSPFSAWLCVPLGLLGLGLSLRTGNRRLLPVYLIFAGYVIGLSLGFLNSRIRMPIIVMLIVFSGYAIVRLAAERQKLAARGGILAAIVALSLIVNKPPEGHAYRSNLGGHFILANAHYRKGNLDSAERHYLESVKLTVGEYQERSLAGLSRVELERGVAQAREDNLRAAAESFRKSLEYRDNFQARINLAQMLSGQDGEDPLPHYRRAAEMAPDSPFPLYAMADYHLRRGELSEARRHLARAKAAMTAESENPEMAELTIRIAAMEQKLANEAPSAAE